MYVCMCREACNKGSGVTLIVMIRKVFVTDWDECHERASRKGMTANGWMWEDDPNRASAVATKYALDRDQADWRCFSFHSRLQAYWAVASAP